MKRTLQFLKVLVLALTIGLGANYLYAQSVFTAPTVAPPGGNPPAPVNVGSAFQSKVGPFDIKGQSFVHGLNPANGAAYVTGFAVLNGNVGIGTANPSSKLQVVGTAKADDFCLNSDATKCLSGGVGGTGTVKDSGNLTIPSTDGTSAVWNHGLGAKPNYVRIVLVSLVNQTAAQGSYLAGDEVEVATSVAVPSGVNYVSVPAYSTATQVVLNHQWASYPLVIAGNRQGAYNSAVYPDKSTWALKIYAGKI